MAAAPGTRPAPVLELRRASRVYGSAAATVFALRYVDLTVRAGEFAAIVGPSGSGKSTCLNILGCLDVPTSGESLLMGQPVRQLNLEQRALLRRDHIGFVMQSANLVARMTALKNVELPLVYRALPRKERQARAEEALAAVGLSNRVSHHTDELSGGQQQRVAIARALVTRPQILIADEPTGALDQVSGAGILDILKHLNRTMGLTVVMVTHDKDIARRAKRVVEFRDGNIVSDRQLETCHAD